MNTARVRLESLIEAAVEVARPIIDKNQQRLDVSLPPQDVWLHVDAVRMSQVIGNVLHNASRLTPTGGRILVTARREPSGLQITVADEGMGIAPVNGLVEMHGGNGVAQSEGAGRGSPFVITLPDEAITTAPAGDVALDAPGGARNRPRRVLVVEDNADAAEAMRMLLTQLGHQVASASSGNEALTAARLFRPEVVLLDIGLPGLDGYEVARTLRSFEETRGARLIAVTGYGQPADRDRSTAAGFDHHLVKPVDPAKLAEAINPNLVLED